KDKKETKTKEFSHSFESSTDNYLELLKTLLSKHGEERYNITVKMVDGMKVQLAGTKKGEALDIDTAEEYKELVTDKILEGMPSKVTIYVDMADIQKRDDEDVHGDNPALYDSNGLSDLDRSLARFRGMLEKRWQNDHDAGYIYIDPKTGTSYPLTPQMMKEWCRAKHDGLANRETPPEHMGIFNPANRQVALHPSRIAAGVNQPQGTSDLGHLASILTAVMGPRNSAIQPFPPSTPKRKERQEPSSLVVLTPSKLPRYLEHAANNLGVTSALDFESPMRRNGYGPDILHLVGDKDLMDLGLTKGDSIRLKEGAKSWWNRPDAPRKRTHGEMEGNSGSGGTIIPHHSPARDISATPPFKKVAFERRFDDGGAERFYGPRIVSGSGEKN
ncbi:hypothetical protein B0H11DRAFT_1663061, partial [Mycena galericulata]